MQNKPPATPKHLGTPSPVLYQARMRAVSWQRNLTPRWISLFCFLFFVCFRSFTQTKISSKRNKICEHRNSGVPQGCNRLKKKRQPFHFDLSTFRGAPAQPKCLQFASKCLFMAALTHFLRHRDIKSGNQSRFFLSWEKKNNFFFTHFWPYMGPQNARACEYEMLNAPGTQNTKETLLSINY